MARIYAMTDNTEQNKCHYNGQYCGDIDSLRACVILHPNAAPAIPIFMLLCEHCRLVHANYLDHVATFGCITIEYLERCWYKYKCVHVLL